MRTGEVLGEDHRVEAIARVIGQRDRLLLGVEGSGDGDRTEDLLLDHPGIGGRIGDDRRLDAPPFADAAGEHTSSAQRLRAEVALDLGEVLLACECSGELRGRVLGIAHDEGLGSCLVAHEELLVDAALHVEPAAGEADLAGVAEDRLDRPVHGVVDVGVLEDDVRALAAELQAHGSEVACGYGADDLAGAGLSREGDALDIRILRQSRSCGVGSVSVHDVEHAGREPCLDGESSHDGRGYRRVLGGLPDDGVAPGQCGHHLPRAQHEGEVPWRDGRDDAHGLPARVGVVPGVHRQGLGRRHARVVGEEADVEHRTRDVVARLGDGLAHVAGVCHGQLVRMLLHEVGEAVHELLALLVSHARPGAGLEGGLGCGDRAIGVGPATACDGGPWLARVGIDVRHRRAVEGRHFLVVDDVTVELH